MIGRQTNTLIYNKYQYKPSYLKNCPNAIKILLLSKKIPKGKATTKGGGGSDLIKNQSDGNSFDQEVPGKYQMEGEGDRSKKNSPERGEFLNVGRHDWTRTNDPYHVKVVL